VLGLTEEGFVNTRAAQNRICSGQRKLKGKIKWQSQERPPKATIVLLKL
jgi:hypothetical protein